MKLGQALASGIISKLTTFNFKVHLILIEDFLSLNIKVSLIFQYGTIYLSIAVQLFKAIKISLTTVRDKKYLGPFC
jgi:hypothetical protein